ncbi:MAG: D-tagatose-bisphosphate aldolase, class II, non-catalytic subunit, partial [Anaerolineae bacterium]|nr:D-tagatose-bisphosphate aldolase, class II, non-catalytic subunit [Anaerolineae bacterium]
MTTHAPNTILTDLVTVHKQGRPVGLYSLCSAHPFVLEACVQQAIQDDSPLLIEATSNQVNQFGGYTGMTPADFCDFVKGIAHKFNFPPERLILGGDHLGPNPWQNEPAERAMDKARRLMHDCVVAGYTKIHLDASMQCADDPPGPLSAAVSAARAAELCRVAEETFAQVDPGQPAPCYIIGTEVPPPGGAHGQEDQLAVTTVVAAQETIDLTHTAFKQRGLDAAWERVMAVVVQPGVEFGNATLFEYNREAAADLSHFIEGYNRLIFEAHSTDYQTRDALKALVEDHFAVLKVGPALTFAFREAVYALAFIETEWLAGRKGVELSHIGQVLDKTMVAKPGYWQKYYTGSRASIQLARQYSFSDRSRYYWPQPEVQQALARLLANLEQYPPPLTLLSQFLPQQYQRVRQGVIKNSPTSLIYDKVKSVATDYAYA